MASALPRRYAARQAQVLAGSGVLGGEEEVEVGTAHTHPNEPYQSQGLRHATAGSAVWDWSFRLAGLQQLSPAQGREVGPAVACCSTDSNSSGTANGK